MKNRTMLYVSADKKNHVFTNSGITFSEFVNGLPRPLENIMSISPKNDIISLESEYERGFEIFRGRAQIQKLLSENIYALGDFCFVDFCNQDGMKQLSEEQVAELLYLGHLFRPLNTPFFSVLQNRFAYLSHDDGFFCKLYCRDESDFACVLVSKIINFINSNKRYKINQIDTSIQHLLMEIVEDGILIDLSEWKIEKDGVVGKIYSIGQFTNMDDILNNCEDLKNSAKFNVIHLSNNKSYID